MSCWILADIYTDMNHVVKKWHLCVGKVNLDAFRHNFFTKAPLLYVSSAQYHVEYWQTFTLAWTMLYKSDIFVLEKLKCRVSGIPEARITWDQNSRLVANGTSLLNVWDSPNVDSNVPPFPLPQSTNCSEFPFESIWFKLNWAILNLDVFLK